MVKLLTRLLPLFIPLVVAAQEAPIERYVREALQSNLAIERQELLLQQSFQKLIEARSLFLPQIALHSRFTRAGGGRAIDFPVGDLLNPVYATLNEILRAEGQPPQFPTDIDNVHIPFLRRQEQETRLRAVQPIFQPAIIQQYRMQREMLQNARAARSQFARELIFQVKKAYFEYLTIERTLELLAQTESMLRENLRVSERLFENQMATREVVFRAQAQLSALQQRNTEAEARRRQAMRYFNFLLNRPLASDIEVAEITDSGDETQWTLQRLLPRALARREELQQLEHLITASKHAARLAAAERLPTLGLVVDYGIQGERYVLTGDADFWTASLALQWNLFTGFGARARQQQASLQKSALELQRQELMRQIEMQVRQAYDSVALARKIIDTAAGRLLSARQSFRLVARRFEEGMASQLAYLDAQNTLLEAEINGIVARYQLQIQLSYLARVAALEPVPLN